MKASRDPRIVGRVRYSSWSDSAQRHVRFVLNFDANRKLLNAGSFARSSINGWGGPWYSSHRLPCLYGDLWNVDQSGHGGFILIAQKKLPFDWDPRHTIEFWCGNVYVYEFEEDCNWAVILYHDPVALAAEVKHRNTWLERETTPEEYLAEHIVQCVRRWNPAQLRVEDIV